MSFSILVRMQELLSVLVFLLLRWETQKHREQKTFLHLEPSSTIWCSV